MRDGPSSGGGYRKCGRPLGTLRLSWALVLAREWGHTKDYLEGAGSFPDFSLIAKGGFCDGALFTALKTAESLGALLVSRTRGFFSFWKMMGSMSWGFRAHRPRFECQLSWSLTLGIQRHLKKKRCDLEEWRPRMSKRKNKKDQLLSSRNKPVVCLTSHSSIPHL